MSASTRGLRLLVIAATTAAVAVATPAAAHGNCAVSSSVPTYASGRWEWNGIAGCAQAHSDWSILTCLQSNIDPIGIGAWTNVECDGATDSGSRTTIRVDGSSTAPCVTARWYRSFTTASAGAGSHDGMSAASAPTLCSSPR